MTSVLGEQLREAHSYLTSRLPRSPRVGIILGSGLGEYADEIESAEMIDYDDVPHLPRSTAIGHAGRFVAGQIRGVDVLAMQGRFHLYEGYTAQQSSLPVWLMKQLGIDCLIVSNASGGLNPNLQQGDLLVIDDHLNLQWANPLIGPNDENMGPRFPDMARPYDRALGDEALRLAREHGFRAQRGVYAAVSGPNYETRAEIRCFRRLGADVVGMSTVPEVLAAVHAGLRVLALSVVTNVCSPDTPATTDGDDVVATAQSTAPKMRAIVGGIIQSLTRATSASTQR